MYQEKRPAPLNLTNINKIEGSPFSHDHSPSLTVRRRRTKIQKMSIKTNQDLIQQSHEMLMQYIDGLDVQVKNLMQNHETQFLLAYRKHSQNVKREMREIRRQMLQNTQNEKHYVDRINFLQKQLVIFRDQTLKMSQTLISKNQEIQNLKFKLKQLLVETKHQKDTVSNLTKTAMGLSAKLQKQQNPMPQTFNLLLQGKQTHQIMQKTKQNLQQQNNTLSKQIGQLKSHTAQMRTRSIRQRQKITISKIISSTIQQGPNGVKFQNDEIFDQRPNSIRTDLSNNRKRSSSFKAKFERSRLLSTEVERMRSKQFAARNEYEKIYIECVEQVRKNIMRKDFAQSLNYFKQNGPKSLVQFKKLDFFLLLELFLKNQAISNKLYQLIFEKEKQ